MLGRVPLSLSLQTGGATADLRSHKGLIQVSSLSPIHGHAVLCISSPSPCVLVASDGLSDCVCACTTFTHVIHVC